MRIQVTADLHYDSIRSRKAAEGLAADICRRGGDVLVLVGDSASAAHQQLRDCLNLFAAFPGRKFMVPGNHCLWCLPGEDSLDRYERIVPALAEECGFVLLDHHPAVLADGTGLVGSVGWYDYSFRDEQLGIPLEFYRAKVTPGAAERLASHKALAEAYRPVLKESHYDSATRWMDGVHVRMALTDEQFLERLIQRLSEQLWAFENDPAVRRAIAFVHHLPFRELVPAERPPPFAFAAAYMGSDRIGQALLASRKLSHVFCGHSHWRKSLQIGSVKVVNVGSTYSQKHLETLDI